MSEINERVVCAAVRCGCGFTVAGVRHFDALMQPQIQLHEIKHPLAKYKQGFMTSRFRFVDRQEAFKIAGLEGQILRRVGGDAAGVLYSENLY